MAVLRAIEAKAILPATDFLRSVQFYRDLGFAVAGSADGLAHIACGGAAFLLQEVNGTAPLQGYVMHLLVEDVDAWWDHTQTMALGRAYDVRVEAPQTNPWGVRGFLVWDPSGVVWRIGQTFAAADQPPPAT